MKIGIFLGVFLLATCAFGQITGTFTRDYNFPPVGLAGTETAQINLVNIIPASSATTPAEAPACTGTVTFTNASGTVIGKPTSFTTTGSQVSSVQLTFSQLQLSSTDVRGEFVASVQLTHSGSTAAICSLVFSLETFDSSSGVTHVYLGNSATGTALIGNPIAVHSAPAN
jgi:hypothetical protein